MLKARGKHKIITCPFTSFNFFHFLLIYRVLPTSVTMASPQCPLSRQAILNYKNRMTLQHVHQIEEHVAASNSNCPHPPLKDIVFNDLARTGSTPAWPPGTKISI